jgi:hypothetical protein
MSIVKIFAASVATLITCLVFTVIFGIWVRVFWEAFAFGWGLL